MNSTSQPAGPEVPTEPNQGSSTIVKKLVLAVVGALFVVGLYLARNWLSIDYLAQQETQLKAFYDANPLLTLLVAYLIYVAVTGLSIPGAAVLSLVYAWFFGFLPSVVLLSFASTTGATIAFLICRYLLRDSVQSRFSLQLAKVNAAFEKEGAYYLLIMRLIPAIPFVVINAVMALTKIRVTTFWWVSQIGMLCGTVVYAYAGSSIPNLVTLKEQGASAVFTSSQLFQITFAFVLLGLFPLAIKKLLGSAKSEIVEDANA
ncbi:MAG: TVP38/TMEM64 family protein [Planctomycetota bacterium]